MPYVIIYVHAKFQKLMRVLAKYAQIALAKKKVQGNITYDPSTQ